MKNKSEQNFLTIARSPWVLVTIPVLLLGMWLINNTWVITDNLDKPYALLAGPATILTGLLAWATFAFFKTITAWSKSTWKAFAEWKQKEGSSFWLVIYIFLAVSVLESGTFFDYLLGPNSGFGALGYASAFAIDLVAVECMRARLGAVRMRNRRGALIHLIGLTTCATISAFANGFTALFHWNAPTHTAIPTIMIQIAPLVGVIFPLLMIFLSLAGDYTADSVSSKLDPEEYRKSEQKRIQLIEIQRDMLRSRIQIEQEIDQMTHRIKAGKSGRTFFLIAWLFPRDPLSMQAVVTSVTEEVKKIVDPQLAHLNGQVASQIRKLAEQNTGFTQGFQQEIRSAISESQSTSEGQLLELTNQIQQITLSTRRLKEEIELSLETSVGEQIATVFQSHPIPDETTIAELIESAIRQYTEYETDEHSTPIDSEKALYPFMTPELKQVVTRFPIVDSWIRTGRRTVSVPDIVAATNFTPQFVGRQASDGAFTGTKTKDIYTTKSVINWLKTNPSPKRKATKKQPQTTEEFEALSQDHSESGNEIPSETVTQNGHHSFPKQTIKLDEYPELVAAM